jgi:hypothetical protein
MSDVNKIEITSEFVMKYSNIRFHENQSSNPELFLVCGRTD